MSKVLAAGNLLVCYSITCWAHGKWSNLLVLKWILQWNPRLPCFSWIQWETWPGQDTLFLVISFLLPSGTKAVFMLRLPGPRQLAVKVLEWDLPFSFQVYNWKLTTWMHSPFCPQQSVSGQFQDWAHQNFHQRILCLSKLCWISFPDD